jgi:hypothetical protein
MYTSNGCTTVAVTVYLQCDGCGFLQCVHYLTATAYCCVHACTLHYRCSYKQVQCTNDTTKKGGVYNSTTEYIQYIIFIISNRGIYIPSILVVAPCSSPTYSDTDIVQSHTKSGSSVHNQ